MKIGFLLNITLLLSFVCSQLMIWLLDGTLIQSITQMLYRPSYMMYKREASNNLANASESAQKKTPSNKE